MTLPIASLALALFTTVGSTTDTTFAVQSDARLHVEAYAGEIVVNTWNRNAVRVQAEHSRNVHVELIDHGPRVDISAAGRYGVPARDDFKLTVPLGVALALDGISTDISVEGTRGEIKVSTVNGDVNVRGGTRTVSLSSVDGEVVLSDARGRMELSAINQGVRVTDCTGDLEISTVNGDVVMGKVQSGNVSASSVGGGLYYDGTFEDNGSYSFSTHNGDIVVGVAQRANLEVRVATYNGDFSASFPVSVTKTRRGKEFNFTLGRGNGQLELESFQGSIQLVPPGTAASHVGRDDKDANSYKFEYKQQIDDRVKAKLDRKLQEKADRKTKDKDKQKDKDTDPDDDHD
jgi:DUF4097 and DUF4098 domain-containing protein YvlB